MPMGVLSICWVCHKSSDGDAADDNFVFWCMLSAVSYRLHKTCQVTGADGPPDLLCRLRAVQVSGTE